MHLKEILLSIITNILEINIETNEDYLMKHNASTSCIDDFKGLDYKIWKDKLLKIFVLMVYGCAISTVATSIFTTMLKDKNTKKRH